MTEETYSDAELEAECHVLGTLMAGKEPRFACADVLPPVAFCEPFHAATYVAIWLLKLTRRATTPGELWALVASHPDAEHFGEHHLVDLSASCVDAPAYHDNLAILFRRAAATCLELADAVGVGSDEARH